MSTEPTVETQFDIAELEKFLEARHKAELHLKSIREWAKHSEEQIRSRIDFYHSAALTMMARFRRETGGKQLGIDRGDGTLWRIKTRAAQPKLHREMDRLVKLLEEQGIWDEARHTKTKTVISNDTKAIMAEFDFTDDGFAKFKSGPSAGETIPATIMRKEKPSVPYTMTVELERSGGAPPPEPVPDPTEQPVKHPVDPEPEPKPDPEEQDPHE